MALSSRTRVNDLLRGVVPLPVNEEQAEALVSALGAVGPEVARGVRLYRRASSERDEQPSRIVRQKPWHLRSAYAEQVRGSAPDRLLDRQAELDELAAWCAGEQPYVWWQAPPWAGKSALMACFVLDPPPHVEVVSFFITARYRAQSDSTAFTDGLLDQLAAIAGETVPSMTEATRERSWWQLLATAVERTARSGRRLVVVVDGLDEDCGTRPGSGLRSVASLLPKRPPEGLRVIVAGRPDPPIPTDVDADHPLRSCPVRQLTASPYAREKSALAQRELDEVLAVDPVRHDGLGRDVLGLVSASGGGLSLLDLQELAGRARYELEHLVHGVFGRVIAGRADRDSGRQIFLFTHDTLRVAAIDRFGPVALDEFRQRIRTWADGYRVRKWPQNVPPYLLTGYPRMLQDDGDVSDLVALASDRVRHDRMLEATGGDTAALIEVAAAQALTCAQDPPDLTSAIRLALGHSYLTTRNGNIPTQLPAIWARLGHPIRAEVLARSITFPGGKAEALTLLVGAVAATGDRDRAQSLINEATAAAESMTNPDEQTWALRALVEASAAIGESNRAEIVAWSITDPGERTQALAAVVKAMATAGNHDRAQTLAAEAETVARSVEELDERAQALATLVGALTVVGCSHRADALVAEVAAVARSITDPYHRMLALVSAVKATATTGHCDGLRALVVEATEAARSINDSYTQASTLRNLVEAVLTADEYNQAQTIATSINDPDLRAWALVTVAEAVAGDHARADSIVRTIIPPYQRTQTLAALARTAATVGDRHRAESLIAEGESVAPSITGLDPRAWALVDLIKAMAAGGDHARAAAVARSITRPGQQAHALAALAEVVAATGDHDRAEALVAEAEAVARSITNSAWRVRALVTLTEAVAAAGGIGRAEAVARSVTDPLHRTRALAALVVAAADDHARADALLVEAETVAWSMSDPDEQARALATLAKAASVMGDRDRVEGLIADAELVARSIADPEERAQALTTLVEAAAVVGDRDLTEALLAKAETAARSITDSYNHARTLAALVESAASLGGVDSLIDEAEVLALSITNSFFQGWALAILVEAVAATGDHSRAETMARSINDPDSRSRALAAIADAIRVAGDYGHAEAIATEAVAGSKIGQFQRESALVVMIAIAAATGNYHRAQTLVWSIKDPDLQARALVSLAGSVDITSARPLVARALTVGPWTEVVGVLGRIDPSALLYLADECLELADS